MESRMPVLQVSQASAHGRLAPTQTHSSSSPGLCLQLERAHLLPITRRCLGDFTVAF